MDIAELRMHRSSCMDYFTKLPGYFLAIAHKIRSKSLSLFSFLSVTWKVLHKFLSEISNIHNTFLVLNQATH